MPVTTCSQDREEFSLREPFHFFSVDVEDWPQSTLNHSLPIGNRVVANTETLLDMMAEHGVKGTFFVLGKVAEKYPSLVKSIAKAGHEVGTHGYSHEPLDKMPLVKFREELHKSVDLLRQQAGEPILGHRAADFSISRSALHLFDVMEQEGIVYDSSIFPIRHPRYGIADAWRVPHLIQCSSGRTITEVPLATIQWGRMVLPGAGGGYLRLLPYWWTDRIFTDLETEGHPTACYMHPYELDVTELKEISYEVPLVLYWSQSANRKTVRSKLKKLFAKRRFVTMAEFCGRSETKQQLRTALDISKPSPRYVPCISTEPMYGHTRQLSLWKENKAG